MRTHDARAHWSGICSLSLAVALAAVSVLGPLVTGAIQWRIHPLVLHQLHGLDAVSLAVVAPLAAAAGALSLRGHPLGALLGFAPAAYTVYMVPQYVLGPDYSHVAGNNERFFPLLLVAFVLGVVGAVLSWSAMGASSEPAGSSRVERLVARRLLPAAAAVVFVRYGPTLADWMSATPKAEDYVAGPSFSWAIGLLDLGVALPATVAVCVGHRHGAAWARRGLYALTGWFALVGTAVAGMAVAMQLDGDPAMSAPKMIAMTVLGGVLVALAVALHAPVLRHAAARPRDRRRPVRASDSLPSS